MAIADDIAAEAQRQGIDPALAIEVANAESGLNPNVPDSPAGAIGLFQLEPATAAQLGVDPRNVAQNIAGGIRYLGMMIAQFGSIPAGLAAYNWGPGNLGGAIQKFGAAWAQHLPSETANYVAKILRNVARYTATVTPASVANGVTQMFQPAPPGDGAAAVATNGGPSIVGLGIVAALLVGAYLIAEVFSGD
jgi:soluble lytic murein transglycosylase-like protein